MPCVNVSQALVLNLVAFGVRDIPIEVNPIKPILCQYGEQRICKSLLTLA